MICVSPPLVNQCLHYNLEVSSLYDRTSYEEVSGLAFSY
jgi:hypothetical protein